MPRIAPSRSQEAQSAARSIDDQMLPHKGNALRGIYAGVTGSLQRDLKDHNVVAIKNAYAFVKCSSQDVALEAEKLLHAAGYVGGGHEVEDGSVYVYAYVMTSATSEAPDHRG